HSFPTRRSSDLKQKIQVTTATKINVTLNYQVCKEVCINQDKSFTFSLPAPEVATEKNTESTPGETVIPTVDSSQIAPSDSVSTTLQVSTPKVKSHIEPKQDRGLLSIFFIAFLSGFAALLTPCVFPMIPMTVSFFTKQSKNRIAGIRNAVIYGISIILIYVALGSVVTAIFGADALNALSTNVWFNLIFFVILIIFALSFLGAFEIMLPNSWANKVDRQADRGGIVGILFMALALAIVSFSCTGPIVGTLLVEA